MRSSPFLRTTLPFPDLISGVLSSRRSPRPLPSPDSFFAIPAISPVLLNSGNKLLGNLDILLGALGMLVVIISGSAEAGSLGKLYVS